MGCSEDSHQPPILTTAAGGHSALPQHQPASRWEREYLSINQQVAGSENSGILLLYYNRYRAHMSSNDTQRHSFIVCKTYIRMINNTLVQRHYTVVRIPHITMAAHPIDHEKGTNHSSRNSPGRRRRLVCRPMRRSKKRSASRAERLT